jgi:hypothetical protein
MDIRRLNHVQCATETTAKGERKTPIESADQCHAHKEVELSARMPDNIEVAQIMAELLHL